MDLLNKHNLKCLFYAVNTEYEKLKKLFHKIKNEFEKIKFSKHFLKGKTTIRRKGKREQKMSFIRNSLRKIINIIRLKKIIKKLPDLKNNLVGFYCKQTIQEFLKIQ